MAVCSLLLAAACLFCAFLPSCAEKEQENNKRTEEALADNYLDTYLPNETYDGASLGMVGGGDTRMKPEDEENAEPVHDAIFRRNAKIQEKFDVAFDYTQTDGDGQTQEKVASAVLAGEHIYDLVYGSFSNVGTYMVTNTLAMSADNIPYLNLSEKWWSQDCTGQLAINGKTVFLTGMIAYQHYLDGTCLFFNKSITADRGIDNHFDDVRSYRWTLDKMYDNMKLAAHDDNGDTVMDGNDTWGYVGGDRCGFNFMFATGVRIVEFDEFNVPWIIRSVSKETVAKVEKICSMLSNRRYSAIYGQPNCENTGSSFVSGKALYTEGLCQDGAASYRPANFYDFGIIPTPMWNEAQGQYYTWSNSWRSGGIFFPVCCNKEELTGVITEALAYQSSVDGGVYYAVLEKYIKGKGTYDYDSEEMIDLILSTKFYDLGSLFWWNISFVVNDACLDVWNSSGAPRAHLSSLWIGRATSSHNSCRKVVHQWDALP